MEKETILEQTTAEIEINNWADLDIKAIVEQLFNQLNQRERDVLIRRFGLHGQKRETLDKIGKEHGLTRERIRQIEAGGINKIKKNKDKQTELERLHNILVSLLEEHGGLMSRQHLLEMISKISNNEFNENYVDFLINKILNADILKINNSQYFSDIFKLRYASLEHLEKTAEELLATIQDKKKLLVTQELLKTVKELQTYQNNSQLFTAPNKINLQPFLPEDISEDRVLYAFLRAMKDLEQNKFGYWGHYTWREIKPKTINDKIYLVLKNEGKPMYYGDIAKKIAELEFDHKKVNIATTHNELILDKKYVLVGRGLYGLKEWGYQEGTVSDVIVDILKNVSEPLTKKQISEKVLEQRIVKQTTINLALMNKDRFTRVGNGYILKIA